MNFDLCWYLKFIPPYLWHYTVNYGNLKTTAHHIKFEQVFSFEWNTFSRKKFKTYEYPVETMPASTSTWASFPYTFSLLFNVGLIKIHFQTPDYWLVVSRLRNESRSRKKGWKKNSAPIYSQLVNVQLNFPPFQTSFYTAFSTTWRYSDRVSTECFFFTIENNVVTAKVFRFNFMVVKMWT